jgi:hypothetical protein
MWFGIVSKRDKSPSFFYLGLWGDLPDVCPDLLDVYPDLLKGCGPWPRPYFPLSSPFPLSI